MSHTVKAKNCLTPSGVHELEEAETPYFKRCTVCGERFYLISETAVREAGLTEVVPRPTQMNPRH